MGSLILCHKKRAKQPYEITRVHMKIYTIEELCYYLCNNLYLIDHTIMNRQLCEWIGTELELEALADTLSGELAKNCTEEKFVLTILSGSHIYAPSEIHKIQGILEKFQNQNGMEKAKFKADSLLQSGEYASAVLVYQSIISGEETSMKKAFYGQVYACMGSAYGRLFLYKEAMGAYKKAYEMCEDQDMLKAYLYSCYRALPEAEYVKMLSGNPLYLSTGALLKEDFKKVKEDVDLDVGDRTLERWKKEYRRIDKNL